MKSGDDAFAGRTIVVTGASDGIGRAATQAFAAGGAHVIMIGRNEAKTAAAAGAIMTATGRRTVTWEIADLSRQDAVRELADTLRARHPRIDILVNNAGALYLDRAETSEGLERTFALNHLSYFTLTLLLLDRVVASASGAPGRVINVASRAHWRGRLDLGDLQSTQRYHGWRAYGTSKLCNILFTRALSARLDPSRAVVHAMHPGVVRSRFATNNGALGRLQRRLMNLRSVTPAEGADTIVWLAGSPDALASNGDYWVRRKRVEPSRAARDVTLSEGLWQASASLAKLDADAVFTEAQHGTHGA